MTDLNRIARKLSAVAAELNAKGAAKKAAKRSIVDDKVLHQDAVDYFKRALEEGKTHHAGLKQYAERLNQELADVKEAVAVLEGLFKEAKAAAPAKMTVEELEELGGSFDVVVPAVAGTVSLKD